MRQGMENFSGIYAITAEELSVGRTNIEVVQVLLTAGIRFIQYREKDKSAAVMYEECLAIRSMTKAVGATFIVNDRVDLALAVQADGVHIGQSDLPPQVVRQLIGEDMILGWSTNSKEQIDIASSYQMIDYIGVGPVFMTATKKDITALVGLELVAYAAKYSKWPFVAIGGIKEANLSEVVATGAKTVAIVSDIVGDLDMEMKIGRLKQKLLSS